MNKFELTPEQVKKFKEWKKPKGDMIDKVGCAGGAYIFKFIPTGIGTIIEVECIDGDKLDLTEWDDF